MVFDNSTRTTKEKKNTCIICHNSQYIFQFLNKMETKHPRKKVNRIASSKKKTENCRSCLYWATYVFKSVAIKYKLGCHTRKVF